MANFRYIARTEHGERVVGTIAGATSQAALAELHARRLAPVEVRPMRAPWVQRRRVTTRQLATAYRQISDLLRAGVPLLRALRLLGRSKSAPRLAAAMRQVADDVADGAPLADALAAHPQVFPQVQIAMVRAGERGGFLEDVLERMGTFIEHQAELKSKVVGSLIYPFVLLAFGLAVVVFALIFLVPKFATFYTRIDLPLPTRLLLGASDLVVHRWLWLIVALAAVVVAALAARRHPAVQRRLAIAQLRVPKMGTLVRDLAVGRFARMLGTLLENGIPLLPAMQISRDAAGHVLLVEAIERATESVRAGETLAVPLGESGLLSEDVLEMISVAESANTLPRVLISMANTIEARIDRLLTTLVRTLEPVVLLALAGMVLFIFVALIVPILRMSSALS